MRVLVALASLALLAGCGVHPGTAAIVDDRTITQEYVAQARADLAAIRISVEATGVLEALIAAPYVIAAAEENGVGVSAADVRGMLLDADVSEEQAAGLGDGAIEAFQFSLAYGSIQQLPDAAEILADIAEQLAAADVTVNPRYGEFDEVTGTISATPPEWIVTPS